MSALVLARRRSFQYMLPFVSTDRMMFSGFVSRISLRSFGNVTGIDVVTTGMVMRKMMSSTSITSTSGVVLIVETTWSSSPEAEPTFMAMVLRPGGSLRAREQDGVQVGAEATHLVHRGLVAADEPVVAEHRRHRDCETDGRHDERLAHGTRDLVDRGLAGDADGGQRVIDAPHRPKP